MRSQVRITTAAVLLLLGLSSCNGVMDLTPKDQFADDAVFADPNLAQAFVNDMYRGLGHGLYEIMLASISDESHFIHNYNTEPVVKSIITSSDRGAIDDGRFAHYNWAPTYSRIRQTNIFLSKIDGTAFDAALKQRMKGEVFFLRAYFYHNLMRMYGGVPIITKVYGLNDDYQAARNSFPETVAFIVANADSAAALLPLSYSGIDLGRATKGAALALKARVLLYAASELYNRNPSGQPENGYTNDTPQHRFARWQAATDAAQGVMDLGIYGLFRPTPANAQEAAKNYGDLFLQSMSQEVILSRFFLSHPDAGHNTRLDNGPQRLPNRRPALLCVDCLRRRALAAASRRREEPRPRRHHSDLPRPQASRLERRARPGHPRQPGRELERRLLRLLHPEIRRPVHQRAIHQGTSAVDLLPLRRDPAELRRGLDRAQSADGCDQRLEPDSRPRRHAAVLGGVGPGGAARRVPQRAPRRDGLRGAALLRRAPLDDRAPSLEQGRGWHQLLPRRDQPYRPDDLA